MYAYTYYATHSYAHMTSVCSLNIPIYWYRVYNRIRN